jgi:hypothetical protein
MQTPFHRESDPDWRRAERMARRELRAGLLRLGGYPGWDSRCVVRYAEAVTVSDGAIAAVPSSSRWWQPLATSADVTARKVSRVPAGE